MRFHLKQCIASLLCLALALAAHAAAADHEQEERDSGVTATIETLPDERGGHESIGKPWPNPAFDRHIGVPDESNEDGTDASSSHDETPPVTLYRWWTNGCPFCESSLPTIEEWREQFGPQGLRVVAVYHPKPPRDVTDVFVRDAARAMGYRGEIAIDTDWSIFRMLTRQWTSRRATSVSFLVDHQGIIRFVHPGPDFYASPDGDDGQRTAPRSRQHHDHALFEAAITALLDQRSRATTPKKD